MITVTSAGAHHVCYCHHSIDLVDLIALIALVALVALEAEHPNLESVLHTSAVLASCHKCMHMQHAHVHKTSCPVLALPRRIHIQCFTRPIYLIPNSHSALLAVYLHPLLLGTCSCLFAGAFCLQLQLCGSQKGSAVQCETHILFNSAPLSACCSSLSKP